MQHQGDIDGLLDQAAREQLRQAMMLMLGRIFLCAYIIRVKPFCKLVYCLRQGFER